MAMRSFEVDVTRTVKRCIQQYATVWVEAESEENAKKKAEMYVDEKGPEVEWEEIPDLLVLVARRVQAFRVREDAETLRGKVAAILKKHSPDDIAAAVAELRKEDKKPKKN
jgi:hypothetical protein